MADYEDHSEATPVERDSPRVTESLTEAECMDLLSAGTVARLVYTSQFGPVALPFEYRMHQGSIVFRTYRVTFTEEDLRTDIPHAEYGIAVELDRSDPARRQGWIVIARGPAHHVDTEAERSELADPDLQPWVDDEPEHFIRVTPTSVWGMRIRLA